MHQMYGFQVAPFFITSLLTVQDIFYCDVLQKILQYPKHNSPIFYRFVVGISNHKFPSNFKFGVAAASYQVEGAWNVSDKSPSIWDYTLHNNPSLVVNNANGDVACDSYHKYEEDVALLKELGVDFYRFSISWSRLLPNGFDNHISEDGLRYYKNLIRELRNNGIEPMVTLFHWDTPQVIEELGGWTSEAIVDLFVAYARVCFAEFGSDVRLWLTFNEPKQTCEGGYGIGSFAPFIKSAGIGEYLCTHNVIKAHAKTWHMYDEEFRNIQGGMFPRSKRFIKRYRKV